jgi:hypothetical protein
MTVERVTWRGRNVFISGAGRVAHSDRAVETASCDDLKCIGLLDLDRAFPTAARHSLLPPVQMPLSGRCSASSLRADPFPPSGGQRILQATGAAGRLFDMMERTVAPGVYSVPGGAPL